VPYRKPCATQEVHVSRRRSVVHQRRAEMPVAELLGPNSQRERSKPSRNWRGRWSRDNRRCERCITGRSPGTTGERDSDKGNNCSKHLSHVDPFTHGRLVITEGRPGSCDLIASFVHIQVQGATDGTPKLIRGGYPGGGGLCSKNSLLPASECAVQET
jgi:hypothetical protein